VKAAVVYDFASPPAYRDFETPQASADEVLVSVGAAALSNLVKAQAAGKHYSAPKQPPFVPGVDGVGRLPSGERVYFAFPKPPYGAMAEQARVSRSLCVPVPDEVDDVTAAAAGNPGMSSWAGLIERARFVAGESVLINGATGVSGRLAIQIAKHLGASRVVATGRNDASRAASLALGADQFIALEQPPEELRLAVQAELSRGVDVVLDYLWGPSAELLIRAIASRPRLSVGRRLRFVQIGSLSAADINLPGAALRSSGLELLGTGIGSVSSERLVQTIGQLLQAVVPAKLSLATEAGPRAEVESSWQRVGPERLVFTLP
jgi:NADPH:quinone reductase-like Zn-dependent oxidoreductase